MKFRKNRPKKVFGEFQGPSMFFFVTIQNILIAKRIFLQNFKQHQGCVQKRTFVTNCKLQPLRTESCNVRAELQPFRNCHNCKKNRTKLLQS